MAHELACGDADLPDVIGAEGRGHGYALRLTEGVVLHGADEIHHHLRYLVRRALRQQCEEHHRRHFHDDEQRVPADNVQALYVIRRAFRQKRAQKIGAYRYHVIQRPVPVHAAKLYGEQHHVRRLRIAEHTAAYRIRKPAEESAHQHQQAENPALLAFEEHFLLMELYLSCRHLFFSHLYTPRVITITAAAACASAIAGKPNLKYQCRVLW